jgi:hypothetical protein
MALATLPALPLHTAGKYVAGSYVVLFALVLIYVSIMAMRMRRVERELGELLAQDEHGGEEQPPRVGVTASGASDGSQTGPTAT